MKQCIECNESFTSSELNCPSCGVCCDIIDGFPSYAPTFAKEGAGFKTSYFSELDKLESDNFWFRARNVLIQWAIQRYCPTAKSFLEIGCGTGYVLAGIKKVFPNTNLYGSELFSKGLIYAAQKLPSVNLMQMDARSIPFVSEFNAIGAFDVLEHIEEDREVLFQIHKALKPEGLVFLTVPQHSWLWSPVDEYACHVRRYSAKDLHGKLQEAGFELLRTTSFVTSLLPVMYLSRQIEKHNKASKPTTGLEISPVLNFLFEKILNLEIMLIRWGINLPLGGSRLIVARKRKAK